MQIHTLSSPLTHIYNTAKATKSNHHFSLKTREPISPNKKRQILLYCNNYISVCIPALILWSQIWN